MLRRTILCGCQQRSLLPFEEIFSVPKEISSPLDRKGLKEIWLSLSMHERVEIISELEMFKGNLKEAYAHAEKDVLHARYEVVKHRDRLEQSRRPPQHHGWLMDEHTKQQLVRMASRYPSPQEAGHYIGVRPHHILRWRWRARSLAEKIYEKKISEANSPPQKEYTTKIGSNGRCVERV